MKAGTIREGRTILAAILAASLVASLMLVTSGAAFAASVAPEFIPGASNSNKTCSANEGAGQDWLELKKDSPSNGVFTDGTLSVTITNYTSNSFDWSANLGVDAVIVKTGADGTNLYRYDPPAEQTSDTNLVTPGANAISHISFCYDIEDTTTTTTAPTTTTTESTTTTTEPTTTTTVESTTTTVEATTTTTEPTTTTTEPTTTTTEPTTTTTVESTTTTVEATTTTVEATTTTVEISGSTVTTAPSTTSSTQPTTSSSIEDEVLSEEILPFTGVESEGLIIIASALAILGSLLVMTTRRTEEN